MKLDDLKNTWQEEIQVIENKQALSSAIDALEKETTSFEKSVKRRDWLETFAALICVPAWIFGLTKADHWMEITGLIILLVSCILIPIILWRSRIANTEKLVGVKTFLLNEKNRVEKQIQLLSKVALWYIAPIFSGVMFFHIGANIDTSGELQLNTHNITYYIIVTLFAIGIYFLNKRAVEKKLRPILEKIEKQLVELD